MAKKAESWTDKLREEYPGIVIDEESAELEVIPTSSYTIDLCTGIRGIPRGRFTEIYGPESSAKTTLALGICKNAIKQGLKVFYVDIEQTLNFEYVQRIVGVSTGELFTLVKPKMAEDAFLMMEEAINTNEYGLVVLDSIGALSPKKEMEDEFTDVNVALVPRLLTKFLRRNAFDVREKNIAVVFINQVRDKIGSYMAMFTTPGGHAIKHYTSLRIALSRGKEIKKAGTPVGLTISFVIKKNKLAPPGSGGIIPLFFDIGIDSIRDLGQLAERLGVVERNKAWYTYEGTNIGHGFQGMLDTLSANQEILDRIVISCYNKAKEIDLTGEDEEDEQDN